MVAETMSPYAYSSNNPVNSGDPTGQDSNVCDSSYWTSTGVAAVCQYALASCTTDADQCSLAYQNAEQWMQSVQEQYNNVLCTLLRDANSTGVWDPTDLPGNKEQRTMRSCLNTERTSKGSIKSR